MAPSELKSTAWSVPGARCCSGWQQAAAGQGRPAQLAPVVACGARGWADSGLIQADLKLRTVHN